MIEAMGESPFCVVALTAPETIVMPSRARIVPRATEKPRRYFEKT
ncbi:MAG: hypothetical protein U0414_39315 [Polyangiaceae bacterium]